MLCTITKTTFTGAQFIAALGGQLTAVGSFNAAAIDLDVSLNGDFSQVGIAATMLNKWLITCQVDSNMDTGFCDILRQGFKFIVLGMYYKLYTVTQASCNPECKCEDSETATLNSLKENACRFLCQISVCLKKQYLAWLQCECDVVVQTYDFSAFGLGVTTDNCINADLTISNAYGCDSCGC